MNEFPPHKADFYDIASSSTFIGGGGFAVYYDWTHNLPRLQHYLLWISVAVCIGGLIFNIVAYVKLRAQANQFRKMLSND